MEIEIGLKCSRVRGKMSKIEDIVILLELIKDVANLSKILKRVEKCVYKPVSTVKHVTSSKVI